ncbi:Ketopantoate reductase ApbA/PanE domain protein [Paenibacillus curdlanolyticus YK9]|uniref:Ketopantoate reductase ApbA/PanE domain protein n=1 Tax=Paenibacillus curdlanolyticus YK9 TaxID=717606 RepID=E0I4N1_9BACL|nr:2-dehydropantoate 2-reductase N-terminal domain-containing protein [Paenibacillus curdlanolyticus]EFM12562.1 Ketopantoate reductase ApbA/PanE domain protein [Paenibacillus curdlanolyticus YK9]
MKILFFGAGVISAIYGSALKQQGHDVVHYVRPSRLDKLKQGIELHLMDGRNKNKVTSSRYPISCVGELPNMDDFDLIVVSVRHYQLENVLAELAGKTGNATLLFFNHIWSDFSLVTSYIPADKFLWGFPSGGGGFRDADGTELDGVLMNRVHIAEINGEATPRLQKVAELFHGIGLRTIHPPNVLHWQWKHFSLNAGISNGILKAGGDEKFLSSVPRIRQGILFIREALEVTRSRGVDIKQFADAKVFFMPSWVAACAFWMAMRINKAQATIFKLHKGAEENKIIYRDLMEVAKRNGVETPGLNAMKSMHG